MPKIKRKKAIESLIVQEFDGLRDDAGGRGVGASYIRNVRFTPDGALEKQSDGKLSGSRTPEADLPQWESCISVAVAPGDQVVLC